MPETVTGRVFVVHQRAADANRLARLFQAETVFCGSWSCDEAQSSDAAGGLEDLAERLHAARADVVCFVSKDRTFSSAAGRRKLDVLEAEVAKTFGDDAILRRSLK